MVSWEQIGWERLKDKVTIVRRTQHNAERYRGQTPLNGRQYRVETVVEEVYDFEDPAHRRDLLEMMAMTVFEKGDYNINTLDEFMDEVQAVIDEVIKHKYPIPE